MNLMTSSVSLNRGRSLENLESQDVSAESEQRSRGALPLDKSLSYSVAEHVQPVMDSIELLLVLHLALASARDDAGGAGAGTMVAGGCGVGGGGPGLE